MKKFLFTLAALLMAGTALADSGFFFGEFDESTLGTTNESNLVLTQDDLAGEYELIMGAYWSARVSGTELKIEYPEGMTCVFAEGLDDMTVETLNARGRTAYETAAIAGCVEPYDHMVTTFSTNGYYKDDEGNIVNYGVNKWEAGYYYEMMVYYIEFDEGFTGGDIVVKTTVASGKDTRGGTVRENGEHTHEFTFTCHVTVEGAEPPVLPDLPGYIIIGAPAANGEFYVNYMTGDYEGDYEMIVTINGEEVEANENGTYQAVEGENIVVVTIKAEGYNDKTNTNTFNYHYPTTAPAPTFVWNEETFTMEAVCEGHTVVLYANGTEVANPYTVEQTDVEQSIEFSAMTVAADEDNNSAVVYYAENPVIIPAKEVVVTPPAAPTYEVTYDDDFMYITFTCEDGAELTIYDEYGQEVAENPIKIARPEYDEAADPVYVHYSAKATKDGVDSETVYVNEKVNQKAKPEPVYTPVPVINVTPGDDAYIFEAIGEGEITLYVNGVEVENPYTVVRTDADQIVEVMAVAHVDGQIDGSVNGEYLIPAKETVEPQDPHATGWWIVIKNAEGELEWYELHQGEDGSWVTTITLNYGQYGTFYWDPELSAEENNANRPNVPYYFVVDGQVWGAPEADQATLMGAAANTMSNPLYENDNFYTVPVGYSYVLGIYVDPSEPDTLEDGTWYYVYCAQGPQTDVNEVNAAKAVAGVRYFNLAGQEMQEANGMTIVVTTYTDSTSSAVKVMK